MLDSGAERFCPGNDQKEISLFALLMIDARSTVLVWLEVGCRAGAKVFDLHYEITGLAKTCIVTLHMPCEICSVKLWELHRYN